MAAAVPSKRTSAADRSSTAAATASFRRRNLLLLATIGTMTASLARAQTPWPVRVIRFVVPFAPGSAIDIPARLIASKVSQKLGATIVVENRAGAGGGIGAQTVAQAAPDGAAFLITSSSVTILPASNPALGFDPVRDLEPISLVCDMPSVLLVKADSRFAGLKELIAEARSAPGRLTYGSGGVGSANHLAAAYFASMAGIQMTHVPYRGTAQTLNAIYAGEIDLIFAPTLDVLSHVRQGRLRALGVTTPERVPDMADVPAIAEVLPGYSAANWFGIFAPPQLPANLRDRMVLALAELRDWPELRERLAEGTATLRLDGPAALAARVQEEKPKWARVVAQLGIKPE